MFRPRVIPCLLLYRNGLYKTVKFKKPRYIGDPINAVRVFNEKEVDELMLLDIEASKKGKEPDYGHIEDIVGEAFMPVCYGGGVKTVEQMGRLFSLGVEKVSIGSAAIENPELVGSASRIFGSQSVVVTLDITQKKISGKYCIAIRNGRQMTRLDPEEMAVKVQEMGAGELVVNNIDRDGTMRGYNHELILRIVRRVGIPVVALGGAGSLADIQMVISQGGAAAAAAGSLFVFYGKLKAVLIHYPSQSELSQLFEA